MKQQVINFQSDIFQKQGGNFSFNCRNDPHNFRYSQWELNDLLQKLGNFCDLKLKWIGNQQNSNILAFFYCILIGTLKNEDEGSQLFIKLKHSLYQQSQQWLSIQQQKLFVQHLCLIQYSKSVGEFLKKSNHFQTIIIKIFTCFLKKYNFKQKGYKKQLAQLSKLQQLQAYSILFPFINFKIINQKIASVIINNNGFHIIEQKQCFFIVENKDKNTIVLNRQKKLWLKTQPSNPQYLKTQKNTQPKLINDDRYLSPKQGSTPKFVLRNSMSNKLSIDRQSKQKISVNIFNQTQQVQKTNQEKIHKFPDRKLTYDDKSLNTINFLGYKTFQKKKSNHCNPKNQSVRVSLGYQQQIPNDFLKKQTKVSQFYDYSTNSKSVKKISPNLLDKKHIIKSTKNLDVKNANNFPRNGFVYQSLGMNQKLNTLEKKPKNKIPKFLQKKKNSDNLQNYTENELKQKLLMIKKAAYEKKYNISPSVPQSPSSMNYTFSHSNNEDVKKV